MNHNLIFFLKQGFSKSDTVGSDEVETALDHFDTEEHFKNTMILRHVLELKGAY